MGNWNVTFTEKDNPSRTIDAILAFENLENGREDSERKRGDSRGSLKIPADVDEPRHLRGSNWWTMAKVSTSYDEPYMVTLETDEGDHAYLSFLMSFNKVTHDDPPRWGLAGQAKLTLGAGEEEKEFFLSGTPRT